MRLPPAKYNLLQFTIKNLIRENKIPQMVSVMQTGQEAGMQTMDQALLELVKRRLVANEHAKALANDKSKF